MNLCYQHQLDSTPTKLLSFSFIRVEIKKKRVFNQEPKTQSQEISILYHNKSDSHKYEKSQRASKHQDWTEIFLKQLLSKSYIDCPLIIIPITRALKHVLHQLLNIQCHYINYIVQHFGDENKHIFPSDHIKLMSKSTSVM